ncbi:hypothetical protein C8C85_2690 [Flavobacterium sp. 103]|nr:hypothetical protein C8C85_2690 [Flavobacterium sp. 103]
MNQENYVLNFFIHLHKKHLLKNEMLICIQLMLFIFD